MQIELKIKRILSGQNSIEYKVDGILKIMNWDRSKLTEAILKHGTSNGKQREAILEKFWGEDIQKNKKRRG